MPMWSCNPDPPIHHTEMQEPQPPQTHTWIWETHPMGETHRNIQRDNVKNHVKFWQSPVKSGSVSNVEHSTKPGRVRHELNLCVGSPVTEAYGKLDNVLELSQSYVRDGQR